MKNKSLILHEDRLFPASKEIRSIARLLYEKVKELPIISPHGHTDPAWFSKNELFVDACELLIKPDHYLYRMLYSQGILLESLGIEGKNSIEGSEKDHRKIWRVFAKNYFLFYGTPSRMWLDTVFSEVFGMKFVLDENTADDYFDQINEKLKTEAFRPRALFDRFKIEVLTTTDSPLDKLEDHRIIGESNWSGRVIPAYRPDSVVDPEFDGFRENIVKLGELTGEDTKTWKGYLIALQKRREFFIKMGATSTDHGHLTAKTLDLSLERM